MFVRDQPERGENPEKPELRIALCLLHAPECQMLGSEAWSYSRIRGDTVLVAGGICSLWSSQSFDDHVGYRLCREANPHRALSMHPQQVTYSCEGSRAHFIADRWLRVRQLRKNELRREHRCRLVRYLNVCLRRSITPR